MPNGKIFSPGIDERELPDSHHEPLYNPHLTPCTAPPGPGLFVPSPAGPEGAAACGGFNDVSLIRADTKCHSFESLD